MFPLNENCICLREKTAIKLYPFQPYALSLENYEAFLYNVVKFTFYRKFDRLKDTSGAVLNQILCRISGVNIYQPDGVFS